MDKLSSDEVNELVKTVTGIDINEEEITRLKEKYSELVDTVIKLHEYIFDTCLSNPIYNAWGDKIDCTLINDAYLLASRLK